MRDLVRDFVGIAAQATKMSEPIYEFGSFLVPEQLELADLRPLFPGKTYLGCDMREGPGVDRIMDLHDIDLPDETAGAILCLDTLEHVEYPHKALAEIHRILHPAGVVLISSVMNFPIHDYPCDYWRFTPEAFRSIMKPFGTVYVNYAGSEFFPHTVIGIGFKTACHLPDVLISHMEAWRSKWTEPESPKSLQGKIRREILRIWHQIV